MLSLERLVNPKSDLSLLSGGGVQRMIQEVRDSLLQRGVIRSPIKVGLRRS